MFNPDLLPQSLLEMKVGFQPHEVEMVTKTGIRSPEELLAVMWNFPSIANFGVDFAKLSNASVKTSGGGAFFAVAQQAGTFNAPPPLFGHGAIYPTGAPAPPGYSVAFSTAKSGATPVPSGGSGGSAGPPVPPVNSPLSSLLDCRPNGNWLVRNQGDRGTCVAFAATACFEQFIFNTYSDLSEQFLYWAIKVAVGDQWPNQDGTLLEYAWRALASEGICEEAYWPYNGAVFPGNVSHQGHGDPGPTAIQDAANRLHGSARYQSAGGAAAVYSALHTLNRPVAVSLPVFADPGNQQNDNWNTTMGQTNGRIFDPPPTSIVVGGHAVCITGFVPDPAEPLGGWFIVRNSWGAQNWGSSLPNAAYHGPEPGYGQISATYVDKFLWELFAM